MEKNPLPRLLNGLIDPRFDFRLAAQVAGIDSRQV
jgi:hypothetical protein